jgi:hypothetical protein
MSKSSNTTKTIAFVLPGFGRMGALKGSALLHTKPKVHREPGQGLVRVKDSDNDGK